MAVDRPAASPPPTATPADPPTADRVSEILAAAEQAAEDVRRDAEQRMRARIAEGARAAQYRIDAAEEEASELVADAERRVQELLRDGHERDEGARTTATSEALAIIARAQENADATVAEATATAARLRATAEQESTARLDEARRAADAAAAEGEQLIANLRAMGDSLHANAERLLRDVQSLHSQMIARIDAADASRSAGGSPRPRSRPAAGTDPDLPDVPEFIPRRG